MDAPSSAPAEESPVALVTGAAGGIGAPICAELASEGHTLVACGRSEEALAALAASLERECRTRAFDVADADACADALAWVDAALGRLDVLVNNAGAWHPEPFVDSTDEHWREVLEVNVIAAARLTRLAVPLLRRSPRARVVNVGSKNGTLGEPGMASYDVSKAALAALTRSLATELAGLGILVNCVAPGMIDTESNAALLDDPAAGPAARRRIPLGRVGRAEEVARAVAFLCGEDCTFVTGATLLVDGGQLAGEWP